MKLSKFKIILIILIISALTITSLISYEFIKYIKTYNEISNKSLYFSFYKIKTNGDEIKNSIYSTKDKDFIKDVELIKIYSNLNLMKSELYILFHTAENRGLSYEEYKDFTYFDSILSKSKENNHLISLDEDLKKQLNLIYDFALNSVKILDTIPDKPTKNNSWISLYKNVYSKYKELLVGLST